MGKGESEAPGGWGIGFLLKIPGGGGEAGRGRGARRSAANWGILGGGGLNIFFGAEMSTKKCNDFEKNGISFQAELSLEDRKRSTAEDQAAETGGGGGLEASALGWWYGESCLLCLRHCRLMDFEKHSSSTGLKLDGCAQTKKLSFQRDRILCCPCPPRGPENPNKFK